MLVGLPPFSEGTSFHLFLIFLPVFLLQIYFLLEIILNRKKIYMFFSEVPLAFLYFLVIICFKRLVL